ncbi:MAG TPA: fused MFS/spermidine synthase [Opitutaceae bacterium]|nr:fused MFS/spermidine synthase [Opitutaceae bacterium]
MLYAATIFTGAFLLFLVQPLIGKYILPWFGGSPGVWTTCLLFFQSLLLGGYAYAHLTSTYLRPRAQAWLHLALLALSLAWIPIAPGADWKPLTGDAPTGRILLLLTACLGLPYLVLSATGPLVQRWFNLVHPGVSPYRLYALSNAGSLLALLGYPFAVEPLLGRDAQSWAWSAGLVVFALLCGACAWQIRSLSAPAPAPAAEPAPSSPEPRPSADNPEAPPAAAVFFWIALPAVASILLVAITNKLSTDVAVTPFLWVLPLALYLLTFILCFDHPRWYRRGLFGALFAASCAVSWHLLDEGPSAPLAQQVVGYAATLFVACMVCHGELYRQKPAPRYLTRFYLCISAGGALGGVAVALLAPRVFNDYHELPLGLWALAYFVGVLALIGRSRSLAAGSFAGTLGIVLLLPALRVEADGTVAGWFGGWLGQIRAFAEANWKEILGVAVLGFACLREGWRPVARQFDRRMAAFPLFMSILLGVVFIIQATSHTHTALEAVRNFYGALKVREYNKELGEEHYYTLSHGITTHGLQFASGLRAILPISYYGPTSGVGRIVDELPGDPGRHIGVVGLGAGSLAAYAVPGDRVRFYEINPEVIRLAHERFTYLETTAGSVSIVEGDARLTMEDELRRDAPQKFDLLVLDAFSSDAIPIHLLTAEAFVTYLRHLKHGGVIAVHISNRYLDLRPVVEGVAKHHGLHQITISDNPEDEKWWLYPTTWVLVSHDYDRLHSESLLNAADGPPDPDAETVLWTDDRASLVPVLK